MQAKQGDPKLSNKDYTGTGTHLRTKTSEASFKAKLGSIRNMVED